MTNMPARQAPKSVARTIADSKTLISEALPKGLDPDRFTRLALTTLRKTPALQDCNPESFIGALLTASALGLEPDVLGEAYLVPYKRECTLIIGYQGLAKLFWQSPQASQLESGWVGEHDDFDFEKGTSPWLRHKPALGDRGKVIAYYAIVGLKSGATWFEVFSPAQIDALRGTSKKSGIRDPEHWMARKTALKQVLKMAPKTTQLASSMALDQSAPTMATAVQVAQGETPSVQPPEYVDGEVVDEQTGEVQDAFPDPAAPAAGADPWAEGGAK